MFGERNPSFSFLRIWTNAFLYKKSFFSLHLFLRLHASKFSYPNLSQREIKRHMFGTKKLFVYICIYTCIQGSIYLVSRHDDFLEINKWHAKVGFHIHTDIKAKEKNTGLYRYSYFNLTCCIITISKVTQKRKTKKYTGEQQGMFFSY